MYEICRLLAPKKAPRKTSTKPRAKSITIGCDCIVMGHNVKVVGKSAKAKVWYDVDFGGKIMGFDRSLIEVI